MGWCSGTDVFDPVADFVIHSDAPDNIKAGVLLTLITALEDGDWDCQSDSRYFDDPLVRRIMRQLHPDWELEGG